MLPLVIEALKAKLYFIFKYIEICYVNRYGVNSLNSFLMSWTPENGGWEDIQIDVERVKSGEELVLPWSVNNSNKPKTGDRFYLIKLGKSGYRGIFASGTIVLDPYEGDHYNEDKASQGKSLKYVDIKFETLLNGLNNEFIVTFKELESINLRIKANQHWTTESSGILINPEATKQLENLLKSRPELVHSINENAYLHACDELDTKYEGMRRTEQGFLRDLLFRTNRFGSCCICGERFPIEYLVAAHIKKRALCTEEEKRDFKNIVAPMCKFGCDELYERGVISVLDGNIVQTISGTYLDAVDRHLKKIVNRKCEAFNEDNRKYFESRKSF